MGTSTASQLLCATLLLAGSARADQEDDDDRTWLTVRSVVGPLLVRVARIRDGAAEQWSPTQLTPCRFRLAPGLYQVTAGTESNDTAFQTTVLLPPEGRTVRLPETEREAVDFDFSGRRTGGIALLFVGVPTMIVGPFSSLSGLLERSAHSDDPNAGIPCIALGTVAFFAGLSAVIAGAVLYHTAPTYSFAIAPTAGGAIASGGVRF